MDDSTAKDGLIEKKYVCGRFHTQIFRVDPDRIPFRQSCRICRKAGLRGVAYLSEFAGQSTRRQPKPKQF